MTQRTIRHVMTAQASITEANVPPGTVLWDYYRKNWTGGRPRQVRVLSATAMFVTFLNGNGRKSEVPITDIYNDGQDRRAGFHIGPFEVVL